MQVGNWTLEDLLDLPDDGNRYEVIDGNLIVTPPPMDWHQAVSGLLFEQLRAACSSEWLVLLESYVNYGGDGRQPDLLVGRRSALRREGFNFTPDVVGLVVEVVSPSSRRTDRLAKPAEYADQGIPLFWRVELDPELVVHPFRLVNGSWVPEPEVRDLGTVPVPWGSIELDLTSLS
jgi:Uma2 family endonuclease